MADDGWVRFGRRVMTERSRRWPVRLDFAADCGLSDRVIGAIENAERTNFKPKTIEKVEAGLDWEFGSAERVRHGLEPIYIEDAGLRRLRDLWPRLSLDARRMLVEIAERSLR